MDDNNVPSLAKSTSTHGRLNKVLGNGCLYSGSHDEADGDAADDATADDADDDQGFSLKCENTIGSDSVGGVADVPTGRPKDGGRNTESQRGQMSTITLTTTNKKVMLGTVDRLG